MIGESTQPATLAAPRSLRVSVVSLPTWGLVLCSRALALLMGMLGAALTSRVIGWEQYDPSRITRHLGALGNVLAGSLVRWDSIHYLQIAGHGYTQRGNTVFFPLYPALIAALATVTRSAVVAGVLISLGSFAVALVLLHRLTVAELGAPAARTTVILLAFAPTAFFFSAVYTESLFLALSLAAFHAARSERWRSAAVWAAAATLTRVPGVLLLAPLALMYVEARRREPVRPAVAQTLRGALPLMLIPLTLIAFFVYLDSRGYGLLAPITNQVAVHNHASSGPIATVVRAVGDGASGVWQLATGAQPPVPVVSGAATAALTNVTEVTVFVISVVALLLAFRRLPRAYGVYSLLVLLLCVWSPSPIIPMLSLNRYVLVIFPLWMVAGAALARRRLTAPVALVGGCLMAVYAFEFARWAFVA